MQVVRDLYDLRRPPAAPRHDPWDCHTVCHIPAPETCQVSEIEALTDLKVAGGDLLKGAIYADQARGAFGGQWSGIHGVSGVDHRFRVR